MIFTLCVVFSFYSFCIILLFFSCVFFYFNRFRSLQLCTTPFNDQNHTASTGNYTICWYRRNLRFEHRGVNTRVSPNSNSLTYACTTTKTIDRPTNQPGRLEYNFFYIQTKSKISLCLRAQASIYTGLFCTTILHIFENFTLCFDFGVSHADALCDCLPTLHNYISNILLSAPCSFSVLATRHSIGRQKKFTQTHAYLHKRMQHTKRCHSYSKQQNIVTRETIHFQ